MRMPVRSKGIRPAYIGQAEVSASPAYQHRSRLESVLELSSRPHSGATLRRPHAGGCSSDRPHRPGSPLMLCRCLLMTCTPVFWCLAGSLTDAAPCSRRHQPPFARWQLLPPPFHRSSIRRSSGRLSRMISPSLGDERCGGATDANRRQLVLALVSRAAVAKVPDHPFAL